MCLDLTVDLLLGSRSLLPITRATDDSTFAFAFAFAFAIIPCEKKKLSESRSRVNSNEKKN